MKHVEQKTHDGRSVKQAIHGIEWFWSNAYWFDRYYSDYLKPVLME